MRVVFRSEVDTPVTSHLAWDVEEHQVVGNLGVIEAIVFGPSMRLWFFVLCDGLMLDS